MEALLAVVHGLLLRGAWPSLNLVRDVSILSINPRLEANTTLTYFVVCRNSSAPAWLFWLLHPVLSYFLRLIGSQLGVRDVLISLTECFTLPLWASASSNSTGMA